MSFQDLAFLLLPADHEIPARAAEAGPDWRFDPQVLADAEVVAWGRGSLPSGMGPATAVRIALSRERALRGLRRMVPPGWSLRDVHRIAPPWLEPGAARNALRSALLGGAIAELTRQGHRGHGPPTPRVLDAAAAAAGSAAPPGRLHPGSGGAVLARIRGRGGVPLILRVARAGGPADPSSGAEALLALERAGVPLVPRPGGHGLTAGASWSAETVLGGMRPSRMTAGLVDEVAALCARFPRTESSATAHRTDLDTLTGLLPGRDDELLAVSAAVEEAAATLPAVLRHGDLWAGNLLTKGSALTGLVDWDAWHPAALPGADLLHVVAMEGGRRQGGGLGDEWRRAPWRSERYRQATNRYWDSLGHRPDEGTLDAIGLAWWLNQAAASLSRLPHLASDPRWIRANVDLVLSAAV